MERRLKIQMDTALFYKMLSGNCNYASVIMRIKLDSYENSVNRR